MQQSLTLLFLAHFTTPKTGLFIRVDKCPLLRNNRAKSRINTSLVISRLILSELKGEIMSEKPEELKKLAAIAADMQLPAKLRASAIEQFGSMASHEALLVLLELAANEGLPTKERDLALKQAREIIKKTSPI